MSWENVLGRVSFINCDPIFHSVNSNWKILSAPPAWLTGHLLRKDCIVAPIPAADYAINSSKLKLIPEIGIVCKEKVGSVLLFGQRPLESMRDIAVPSDSSTSTLLLKWLLSERGQDPRYVEMGPDIESMLDRCDGALIIGDRAIITSISNPDLVRMDLGKEWTEITGLPMVFGVFASLSDSSVGKVNEATEMMLSQYHSFLDDDEVRKLVVEGASQKIGLPEERVSTYFDHEVSNLLDSESVNGLMQFLETVCKVSPELSWF